ncbi:MAG: hypothetical protein KAU14_08705, partial [Thermoplasmata archaeon]|nr:hypothetical protein [Thermoplasmata archaeon]
IDNITGTIKPGATVTVEGNITIVPDGTVQVVKVYLDGVYVKDADSFTNTNYTTTLKLPGDLTEGNHVIKIEAILVSSESNTAEEIISYHADPVDYVVTVTIAEPSQEVKPDAAITVASTISVEPAAAVQAVKYYLDNGNSTNATTFSSTNYTGTLNLPADFAEGDHRIMVEVTIEPGDKGYANRTISYYPGSGKYTITITINDIPEKIEPGRVITVAGNITVEPQADVQSVKIYLDGNFMVNASSFTNTEYTGTITLPSGLTPGDHIIMVRAILVTGESDTANRTITHVPASGEHFITVKIDEVNGTIEPGKEITISGTITMDEDAELRHVRFFLDGTEMIIATITGNKFSGKLSLPTDLTEGDHTITANGTLVTDESYEDTRTVTYTKESGVDNDDDDDGGGIGSAATIAGVVVVLIVVILIVLIMMGVISLGGKKGEEERVPEYPEEKETETREKPVEEERARNKTPREEEPKTEEKGEKKGEGKE